MPTLNLNNQVAQRSRRTLLSSNNKRTTEESIYGSAYDKILTDQHQFNERREQYGWYCPYD
jgi:hypothetical protein